jgi:hypothetical protein
MTALSLILVLVVIPAVIGYCLYIEYAASGMAAHRHPATLAFWRESLHRLFRGELEPGDFLIYRKSKVSPRPGPRARNVQAAERGDDYYYEVDKYWTVADVLDDGRLVAVTRTGKQVYLTPEDENLRKAGWLERFRHRRRFPSV